MASFEYDKERGVTFEQLPLAMSELLDDVDTLLELVKSQMTRD